MKAKDRWSCLSNRQQSLLIAYVLPVVKKKRGCKTNSAFPSFLPQFKCPQLGLSSSGHSGCSSPLFTTAPRKILGIFSWVEPGAQPGKHHMEPWTGIQQQLRNNNPHRAGSSQRGWDLEHWPGITQSVAFTTNGCRHTCYQPTEDEGRNLSCPRGSDQQTPESPLGKHRAEVLKWEQLIAWQTVELAGKRLCVLQDQAKNISVFLFWERRKPNSE